ncbi:MAG: DNA translocase FtsK, partial [bacterium]
DVQDMIANGGEEDTSFQGDSDGDDELMRQAIEVLKTSDRISTSLLQRRLKIGYNRAARIMETLDERGLVPKNFE